MIRALLVFIFFLIIFTISVFFALKQPGFVSFSYGTSEYTIRLVDFIIGLFILFPLVYIFLKLVSFLFNAPSFLHNKINKRRMKKTLEDTQQGLTKYLQGEWPRSEKLLLRSAGDSSCSSINYVWAACAAHKLGKYAERDAHIATAKKANPGGVDAIEILQAELLLEEHKPDQALVCLDRYRDSISTNSKIATLFATAYQQLEDWERLAEILLQIKTNKNLNPQTYADLEKQTLLGLLIKENSNAEDIGLRFKDAILGDQELTVEYVTALRRQGKHELAESVVVNALDLHWCSKLVRQYGLLNLKDYNQALTKAEKWSQKHTTDAYLFLTLGRICKKAQLWGKAKTYFESSLNRKPLAETYAELTALHEQLNELDEAQRCAKQGLKFISDHA